jgi:3'(2'), 5'-bisphosphate nucleotidase
MSVPFAAEKQVAVVAVRRACTLTRSVFNKLVNNETLIKGDKSPVTGALLDFFYFLLYPSVLTFSMGL